MRTVVVYDPTKTKSELIAAHYQPDSLVVCATLSETIAQLDTQLPQIMFIHYQEPMHDDVLRVLEAIPIEKRPLLVLVNHGYEIPDHYLTHGDMVMFASLPEKFTRIQLKSLDKLLENRQQLKTGIASATQLNDELNALIEASTKIHSELEMAKRIGHIVKLLEQLIAAKDVQIFVIDTAHNALIRYTNSDTLESIHTLPLNRRNRVGRIALSNVPTITAKWAGIPLTTARGVVGVIVLITDHRLDISSHRRLDAMVPLLGTAIQNAKLYKDAQNNAWLDGLTGLYNRQYFDQALTQQFQQVKAKAGSLGVMLIDIDHFKRINDTHGHQVGDAALQLTAKLIRDTVRQSDLACRYGGEEMAIIMPQINEARLTQIAEQLCQKVAGCRLRNETTGETVALTISCGYSIYPDFFDPSYSSAAKLLDDTEDVLVYMADKALYRAKNGGRNRWLSYFQVQQHDPAAYQKVDGQVRDVLQVLKQKDPVTYAHCLRVGRLGEIVARQLKLSPADCALVMWGGRLHDIGKCQIPTAILCKDGQLTKAEFAIMKNHTKKGVSMIRSFTQLSPFKPIILSHHENYDGTGYPAGLQQSQIPWSARIISVVDTYDAISVPRPYDKREMSDRDAFAVSQIRKGAESRFDAIVVDAFLACYDELSKVKHEALSCD